jgi:hypothetical protein
MPGSSVAEISAKERFINIRNKAGEMGVLDMNFSGKNLGDSPEYYEKTLEIIAANKDRFDRNAGEGKRENGSPKSN